LPRKELWCLVGRRSGKSRIAAAVGVFLALFEPERLKLAVGEQGIVAVVAVTKEQANVIFAYIRGFLEASDLLRTEIVAISSSLNSSTITLANHVSITVFAGSFRSIRGRTLLAVIVDEVAFLRSEEAAYPDVELVRAVTPSLLASKGMLIGVSTGASFIPAGATTSGSPLPLTSSSRARPPTSTLASTKPRSPRRSPMIPKAGWRNGKASSGPISLLSSPMR
jgi:phage terminase large subunit-like protein